MRRILALLAFACLASAPSARAADVPVTTTADHDDQVCNAADCTLREAFNHSSGGDVVLVPAGRYLLGSSLTLFHTLTVRGAGVGQTIIDGNGKGRAIEIDNAGDLDLGGVTVTGGRPASGAGGGILVTVGDGTPGVLTLRDSVVSGNGVTGSGGGIASQGSTTIVSSTISGNSATGSASAGPGTGGGVVATQGSLQVLSSTISANTTDGSGAGMTVSSGVPTTIQSSTIAGNTSSGAGLSGGIALGNLATVTATGSIIAGNRPVNCSFGRSAALGSGYDLSDDTTCRLAGTGDQQGADPLLGPLADNGGPTPTRLPATGSPAIDRGAPSGCPATDQRGTTRPQGSACDIGAVEVVPLPPLPPAPPAARPTVTPPVITPPGGGGPVTGAGTLPPPVEGRSGNLSRTEGTVLIKLPGSKAYVKLTADRQVPVGTVIDATKGRVSISVADGKGGISTAVFYGGVFRFTQTQAATPLATMTLVGAKPACASTAKAKGHAARTAAKKKAKSRHLWGDGKGNFQTKGQYSSATVRGTKWLVQDTCAGTTTKVSRGIVAVADFVKRKTVLVKAGHSYLARPKKR
jgi:CSLREA domain-containing protein